MKKLTEVIIIIILTFLLFSCGNKETKKSHFKISFYQGNIYKITKDSSDGKIISFYYDGYLLKQVYFENKESLLIDMFKVIKGAKNKKDIALAIAEKGQIPIRVTLGNSDTPFENTPIENTPIENTPTKNMDEEVFVDNINVVEDCDSIIIFKPIWNYKQNDTIYAKVTSGICAKLEERNSFSDFYSLDVKRYLYDKRHNVSDSIFNKMVNILMELERTDFKEYFTRDKVPILSSYPNNYYTIQTNMKADYYYLLMKDNEEGINSFIKERTIRNFEGGEKNIAKRFSFWRNEDNGGVQVLFLIGIDKDWSKQIIPIGLVAIDNFYPSSINISKNEYKEITLSSYYQKIHIPKSINLNGFASLKEMNSSGNGLSCQVSFSLSFGGDVKSITLVREKHLTYPYPPSVFGYNSFDVRPERKVIDLTNKTSPYIFKYTLHLDDGDNYLPVIVTDMRGNQTKYEINIPASFTREPDTEININNNIYN